jgi:hypothetical protein
MRRPLEDVLTDAADGVVDTELQAKDVMHVSLKVNYIVTFYHAILEKYHSAQGNKQGKKGFSFLDCANCAVKLFNTSHAGGIIQNGQTLLRWHQAFRVNCKFQHPLAHWKSYEPKVFQEFPVLKIQTKRDLDALVKQENFNTDVAMEYF